VIGHREGSNAAGHAEDRREQRTLVPEQQGYAEQEGGDAAESREGQPVPAHARHDRRCPLKIDDHCSHQPLGAPEPPATIGDRWSSVMACMDKFERRCYRAGSPRFAQPYVLCFPSDAASRGKTMKVLLTGGSGNLGQALVPRLLDKGDTPLLLDVRAPSPLNEGAVFIEGSILDRSKLTEIFRGCDCIVHIAGWHGIHEDRGERDAYDFFDLNVRGTFEVFEAAACAGIGKVIYISTTSVYTVRQQQDSRRTDRGGLPKAPPYQRRYTARGGLFRIGIGRFTANTATGRAGSGRARCISMMLPPR
jgi:hypothetical protein